MTIRRRCTERNCKNGKRCLEHLRFDVVFRGNRYRIPVNKFAIPRMSQASSGRFSRWRKLGIGSGCSSAKSKPVVIPPATEPHGTGGQRAARCLCVSRRVHGALRQASGPSQHRSGP